LCPFTLGAKRGWNAGKSSKCYCFLSRFSICLSTVKTSLSLLLGSLLCASQVGAQQNSADPNAQALDVLRKAIADYEKNPNAAAAAARTNLPAKNAGSKKSQPTKAVEATPAEPVQATPPIKPNANTKIQTPAAAAVTAAAPMAQMYLDGKVTAKQFQKYLQDHTVPAVTAAVAKDTGPQPVLPPPLPANDAAPTTPAGQSSLTDVDKKLDDLLRAKAEREKSATTNTVPTGPKTKRQRLDEILKQLVDGKISDEEYKTKREKILSEPN
jgi:hypothetical protein